jgi:methylglyoxal synthase
MRIALVAHDNKKANLLEWVRRNKDVLANHALVATNATGAAIEKEMGISVERLLSGPLGGDLQLGAKTAEDRADLLLFFWDPLEPQPHDPDVKALLRIAVVWNIPVASNRATADFLISSPLFGSDYQRTIPNYDAVHTSAVPTPCREGQ